MQAFKTALSSIISVGQKVIGFLGDLANHISQNKTIMNTLHGALTLLVATFEVLSNAISTVIDWMSDNKEYVEGLGAAILVLVGAIGTYNAVMGTWNTVTKIAAAAQTALNKVLNANPIGLVITAITALIAVITLLWNNCEGFRNAIIGYFEHVKQNIKDFGDAWWAGIHAIGDVFNTVGQWIKDTWESIPAFFAGIWQGIQNAFSNVANWFRDTFSKAWEGIKNVFSATGEMFGNIGKSILNGLSTVINGIIWGINQVIRMPLDGLNTILRIIHDIDIFGLKPFSWIGQIPVPQIPSIPMLAQGGVLKKGQMALLEGQGDEAVIPLSQNTEWIDKVADRLSKNSEPQQIYYSFNIEVANMRANSREDIENLAEILMDVMAQKTSRKGMAF